MSGDGEEMMGCMHMQVRYVRDSDKVRAEGRVELDAWDIKIN